MYVSFYRLKEKPFSLTPDPRYLYLSPSHRDALAHLVYGILEKQGFMVVTGEVGTGKTTLVHTLLSNLDPDIKTAFVFYSRLHLQALLQYVLDDFGCQTVAGTTAQYLMQLNRFLIEQRGKGKTAVLIIDEAQNLPLTLLEDIRMLSNLEFAGEKLLQIILLGQPELQRKLQLPSLRQLRQRIVIACRIQPLSSVETRAYIRHRLAIAGGEAQTIFTPRAFKTIHAYAGGIPRLVNTVCDQALLAGYADGQQRITPRLVRQVGRDLDSCSRSSRRVTHIRKAAAVLVGLLLVSMMLAFGPQVRTSLPRWYRTVKAVAGGFIISISEFHTSLADQQDRPESAPRDQK
jgi:general secretion pathway protein A